MDEINVHKEKTPRMSPLYVQGVNSYSSSSYLNPP